jgi:hypothetical protein
MLSESLFGNWFMLQHYEPMQKMYYSVGGELTEGYVSRLNLVSKTIVETAIREHDWYPQGYLGGVHGAYESVLHDLMYRRYKDVSVGLSIALHSGIADLYKPVMKAFDKMPIERLTMLYGEAGSVGKSRRRDHVDRLRELRVDSKFLPRPRRSQLASRNLSLSGRVPDVRQRPDRLRPAPTAPWRSC